MGLTRNNHIQWSQQDLNSEPLNYTPGARLARPIFSVGSGELLISNPLSIDKVRWSEAILLLVDSAFLRIAGYHFFNSEPISNVGLIKVYT